MDVFVCVCVCVCVYVCEFYNVTSKNSFLEEILNIGCFILSIQTLYDSIFLVVLDCLSQTLWRLIQETAVVALNYSIISSCFDPNSLSLQYQSLVASFSQQ